LELHLHHRLQVLPPGGHGPAAEAEDLGEEVKEVLLPEALAFQKPPVVPGPLLGVGEDGVGLIDLLEALLYGLVPGVAVRVVLPGPACGRPA
jgi:hypothetical protein